MLIVTYVVHKNLHTKPERFYTIIFDTVYTSSTLSSLLSTLAYTDTLNTIFKVHIKYIHA